MNPDNNAAKGTTLVLTLTHKVMFVLIFGYFYNFYLFFDICSEKKRGITIGSKHASQRAVPTQPRVGLGLG
jgi:hypothetical protein